MPSADNYTANSSASTHLFLKQLKGLGLLQPPSAAKKGHFYNGGLLSPPCRPFLVHLLHLTFGGTAL